MTIQSNQPEDWAQLTPEQKRQRRLENLTNTKGMSFPSPEAEKAYKVRTQRMVDVYNLKEPDRVPVNLPVGNLPLKMAGIDAYTAMYEPEKAIEANRVFNEKYGEELEYTAYSFFIPGQVLDLLDPAGVFGVIDPLDRDAGHGGRVAVFGAGLGRLGGGGPVAG